MKKKAIITGITGQDGSYLAELLLKKNYQVHGLLRRTSFLNLDRIQHIINKYESGGQLTLHYIDMIDTSSISSLVKKIKPNEFYNLAAMSHVGISFYTGEATLNINAVATYRILDAITKNYNKCKFYQASSSEMFGITPPPQNENSLFNPQSPYGISKVAAFYTTRYFRQAHKMFAANGILFNHESPLRGETFVTRKITRATSRIALGLQDKFYLGNLDAKRDWGHAKDYVRMMWMILQAEEAEDWVIATGKTTTVRDFVRMSFAEVGVTLRFEGEGVSEVGIIDRIDQDKYQSIVNPNNEERTTNNELPKIGKEVLAVDPKYFRPTEVDLLIGDPTKANTKLGWIPEHDLASLIKAMMKSDIRLMKKDQFLKDNGYVTLNYFE